LAGPTEAGLIDLATGDVAQLARIESGAVAAETAAVQVPGDSALAGPRVDASPVPITTSLLLAVPEPGTGSMLVTGVAMMLLVMRRRLRR
jgi:hypothetical protein